ncbi:MAG: SIMPL domain-containing protein [Mangrovibacterium sp.]
MKKLVLSAMLFCGALMVQAQTGSTLLDVPYLSVVGEAYQEFVPDEIYVSFTLAERYDGKIKIELTNLDKELQKKMKSAGFNLEKLSVLDANLSYVPIKRKNEDVLASKTYKMKLSTSQELTKIWQILDEVEAKDASIYKFDLSNMDEVKCQIRKNAVKNAKQKAEDMIGALSGEVGQVLYLEEEYIYARNEYAYSLRGKAMSVSAETADETIEPIEFEKIKVECRIRARFAIK